MANDYKPPQGDEAELFASYNDELMRRVRAVVRTSDAIVEDACSIAWAHSSVTNPIDVDPGVVG